MGFYCTSPTVVSGNVWFVCWYSLNLLHEYSLSFYVLVLSILILLIKNLILWKTSLKTNWFNM